MEAALVRLVYPAFGNRPIDSITRSDMVRLLDTIEDDNGPAMANEVLGIVSRVFDWHSTRTDSFRSPIVKGMKRAGGQARSRVLTDEELRAVWNATGEYAHPYGPLVRFVLLTATPTRTRLSMLPALKSSGVNGPSQPRDTKPRSTI